jgi:hypothetical protein
VSEDQRSAVGISVTLSSQLIAAALAMIAVAGAFTTLVVDKRITGGLFWFFIGGSFLCFVISIFAGGRGVTAARDTGFAGNWTLNAGKNWFNGQAIACIGGLTLFVAALLASSKTKDDPTQGALTSVASNVLAVTGKVTEVAAKVTDLAGKVTDLAVQQKVHEQKLAQILQTFEASQEKNLMLERLEKEQQHLEELQGRLQKTITDLQASQNGVNDALHDLKVQIEKK